MSTEVFSTLSQFYHFIQIFDNIYFSQILFWFYLDQIWVKSIESEFFRHGRASKVMGCFIYILDSSNSSSITFWTNQFGSSSSRRNWTSIWTGNSNGSWTDKQSSYFSTVKEMSVNATLFSCKNHNKQILKWFWNVVEIALN